MKTEVVCIKGRQDDPSIRDVIYVGRPVRFGGWDLPGHPLANPFRIQGAGSAERAVAMYDKWLDDQHDLLVHWLPRFRGKRLGCWCQDGEPCHARVLAKRADEWKWYKAPKFVILYTASRHLKDRSLVYGSLDNMLLQIPVERKVLVMQGKCPSGGDLFASEWALRMGPRIVSEDRPAAWHKLGRQAGRIRNEEMVDEVVWYMERGAGSVCLAAILECVSRDCSRPEVHGSHGASHCADYAKSKGILTYPYEPWRK